MRKLAVGAIALLGAAASFAGTEPQLRVNFNPIVDANQEVLLGALDPTYIQMSGLPGVEYTLILGQQTEQRGRATRAPRLNATDGVRVGSVNPTQAVPTPGPTPRVSGTFDAQGAAQLMLLPGAFAEGSKVAIQLITSDGAGTTMATSRVSANVVRTMSANIQVMPANGSLADVQGPVLAKTTAQIMIGNLIYNVTANTDIANADSFADINVGDWVDVKGDFAANGPFTATEIGVEDAQAEVRLSGRVQGIGPAGMALLNVSVYVNDQTTYVDLATGLPASYADITLGMPIEIRVGANEMFPSATAVALNAPIEPEPEPEPEPEVENEDPPPPPRPFCS
ncbi:MAG: hypothetical protein KDA32_05865 [Phycisphaerales bacterium]|nr:hypothetical protein [Phycisphaerales bacterium]